MNHEQISIWIYIIILILKKHLYKLKIFVVINGFKNLKTNIIAKFYSNKGYIKFNKNNFTIRIDKSRIGIL